MDAIAMYTQALCDCMYPVMIKIFIDMFEEAKKRGHGHRDNTNKLFLTLRQETINWNSVLIEQHVSEFKSQCSYFDELLAAVFICYANTLTRAIRKKNDNRKLELALPTDSEFIHACIVNTANIMTPEILRESENREEAMKNVCVQGIKITLNKKLPMQDIVRTYVPINKNFSIGEEEPELPEPEPIMPELPEPQEEPQAESPKPAEPEEVKEVKVSPFSAPRVQEEPDLFPDAAEKTSGEH